MFEKLAYAVLKWDGSAPGNYTAGDIYRKLTMLPLGVVEDVAQLEKLGESLPVDKLARKGFFDAIEAVDLRRMQIPFLVHRRFLENLEAWGEWKTLSDYLEQFKLRANILFLNDPMNIEGGPYYLGEIRVLPDGGEGMKYEFRP